MADLTKMTRKQLERLIADAQRALKSLEAKEMRDAKKAAEQAAAKFGFKLSELTGGATRTRKAAAPARAKKESAAKYANPADPKQTWTGKGRQPQWFKDKVAAGTDPKTLEI